MKYSNKGLQVVIQILICAQIRAVAQSRDNFYQQDDTEHRYQEPALPSFDSLDVYQSLNFKANWTTFKVYWKSKDFDFEGRYLREQTCFTRSHCELPQIQVFVVPFSHNDPGWLQTYEGYFNTKTRFILDNAVEKLSQYDDMTFVWSEISFLSKWWNTVANSTQKQMMKRLLHEGRLEILTGGWVMSDEASPSIFAQTHQLIEGHSWLKRNLNYKPRMAWSIDPFGHGSVMPYLLKSSGLDGMMIQRLHYAWKHWLAEHKYGDFVWNQGWDKTGKHGIHCLNAPYDLYPTKHSCGPTPEECLRFNFRNIDSEMQEQSDYMKPVTQQNIQELADRLMGQYRRTASLTRHNVVITGIGSDFEFNEAIEWDQQYVNYRKLFDFINRNPQRYNAKLQFGTLAQYFQAVQNTNVPLPSFQGDFFPYSDVYFAYAPAYWTGYYGTRPFWKKLSRETEDELRKAEILFTFTLNYMRQRNYTEETQILARNFNYLVQARRWLALFQHHDGITGTSPRPTMIDYAKKLFDAIRFSEYIQSACVKLLLQRQNPAYLNVIDDSFANLADQVPLKFTDRHRVKKISIFNGIGWRKSHLVRVLVDTTDVIVIGSSGEQIMAQINPKIGVTDQGNPGIFAGHYEIVFMAYLPPFAVTTYEIRMIHENENPGHVDTKLAVPAVVQCRNCPYNIDKIDSPYISLNNHEIEVVVDAGNGLVQKIRRKSEQVRSLIKMTLGKYSTVRGSGAYLSRPNTDQLVDIMADCKLDKTSQLYVLSGPVIQEITMICKEIMISTYLLQQGYPEALSAVYLSNSVKPSMVGRNDGEFFMSFETDLETTQQNNFNHLVEPVFYTDNGLAPQKRMRVSRLPYEGNLYPVVNYAYIQDVRSRRRFSVLIDRAHGFTSSKSGHLETVFDRRMPFDDGRGMDEGVNDPEDMVSNYVLLLETVNPSQGNEMSSLPTLAAQRASKFLNHQPSIFVYNYHSQQSQSHNDPIFLFSKEFPLDVFLLNFRTAPGTSRGVPGRKALMIFQNLGHATTNDAAENIAKVLRSDLRLNHFTEASDLMGDSIVDDYADVNFEIKTGSLTTGKPFELTPFVVHF